MSHRNSDSLRRGIVINPAVPVPERLRALKELKPTRRFLEHLLKADIPPRLHAEASKILLSLPRKSKSPGVPNPKEPSPVPARASEFAGSLFQSEPVLVEPEFDSHGRQVVTARLFDCLTLGDPNSEEARAWAEKWNLIRGSDPEELSPLAGFLTAPADIQPYKWRDSGGGKDNE
jgi:hypothetical protein